MKTRDPIRTACAVMEILAAISIAVAVVDTVLLLALTGGLP